MAFYSGDDSGDSDFSLMEALSGSERFQKGNITFDWSSLPTTILSAVPDPPQSAQKQLQRRRTARARKEKENIDTRSFVTEKLAEWAGRSLRVDGPHGGSRGSFLNKSHGSDVGASFNRSRSQLDLEKLYTFNHCKFTYRERKPKSSGKDRDEGDDSASSSDSTEEKSVGKQDVSGTSHPRAEDAGRVRPETAEVTGDSSLFPAAGGSTSRLDIRQLLDIVQDLQKEEIAAANEESSVVDVSHVSERNEDTHATLLNIHKELSALAKRVKAKNADLKRREQEMVRREEKASSRDGRIAAEIEKAVRLREGKIMEAAKKSCLQHEDTIAHLSKENRRLQTSVKNLIASNKQVREQVKKLQQDAQSDAAQLTTLQSHARTARERLARLKAAADARTEKDSSAMKGVGERDGLSSDPIWTPKRAVSTQTAADGFRASQGSAANPQSLDFHSAVSSLMRVIMERHQCQNCRQKFFRLAFEDLVTLFPQIPIPPHSDREHLQFMLDSLTSCELAASEMYTLAHMGYTRLNSNLEETVETRMLLQFIVLSGVTQPDVIHALLENVGAEVASAEGKSLFLAHHGVRVVHPYLRYLDVNIPLIASATLLIFCSEGELLQDFIVQCSDTDVLDSLAMVLTTERSAGTVENVSVIVQKMSRVKQVRAALRAHPVLLPRLRELAVTPQSEFLAFNLRSALNNLS